MWIGVAEVEIEAYIEAYKLTVGIIRERHKCGLF